MQENAAEIVVPSLGDADLPNSVREILEATGENVESRGPRPTPVPVNARKRRRKATRAARRRNR